MSQQHQQVAPNSRFYTPGPAFDDCQADVLLYSFYSGADSGEVGAMTMGQLLHALPSQRVADFALDRVLDYRSRRPRINIQNWVMEGMQFPSCTLERLTDYSGRRFLVLHGMEPDINWDEFSRAVVDLARWAGVEEAVDLQGINSGVPHTRPPIINHVAPRAEYLPEQPSAPGNFSLPAGFGQYLQLMLSAEGIKAHGMLVTVPYYISDAQYPQGAVVALEYLADELHLDLPLGDLEASVTVMENELSREISESEEAQTMIRQMEEHYDQAPPGPWERIRSKTLAEELESIGSTQLASRVENYLARISPLPSEIGEKIGQISAANYQEFSPAASTGDRSGRVEGQLPNMAERTTSAEARSADSEAQLDHPAIRSAASPDRSVRRYPPRRSRRLGGTARSHPAHRAGTIPPASNQSSDEPGND